LLTKVVLLLQQSLNSLLVNGFLQLQVIVVKRGARYYILYSL